MRMIRSAAPGSICSYLANSSGRGKGPVKREIWTAACIMVAASRLSSGLTGKKLISAGQPGRVHRGGQHCREAVSVQIAS